MTALDAMIGAPVDAASFEDDRTVNHFGQMSCVRRWVKTYPITEMLRAIALVKQ